MSFLYLFFFFSLSFHLAHNHSKIARDLFVDVSGSIHKASGGSVHAFELSGDGTGDKISLINCTFHVSSSVTMGSTHFLGMWITKVDLDYLEDVQMVYSGSGSTVAAWSFGIEFRFYFQFFFVVNI